ncbi:DUF6694 family lipoprotein [Pseudoalteromonas piratica]|uniref:Lipoprotein n=1 Tax=Pseudoalteromonas piratica TaxID=1348114 RepID=A0A0A7EGU2_9GAMM|nr:DUF6694 family lipoprotein [Pseudoalteromonas piratica]AIY65182.1 hypothetical protein OM33_08440 [Pseudoalteromonas piratica]
MKKLLIPLALITLSGCFGPAKFDSTDQSSIQSSTQAVIESLPEADRPEFKKAIMYYSIGGKEGFSNMLGAAFSGADKAISKETMIVANLADINGLTGQEILTKYRAQLEQNKIEAAERKAKLEEKQKQMIREMEEQTARRNKERENTRKVITLEKEAKKLLENNKFKEAIAKYEEMAKVDSGAEKSQEGIDKTIQAMNDFEEKLDYINKIELTEFTAKRIDTYSKKGVPAVRLSLKNNGERSLDKVKIVVYFKDKDDNVIYEEDYLPVLVSRYSFGNNKPLKPGYVREQEKGKYYTLDSALSNWKEGNASARIVDIEFSSNL